ncbi:hypothetical protein A3A46_01350 [Candidatus Roizmanbacteria bacterium RIFCSPLOWO2_01_FULL_37_13]|uniref:Glutathionylspermidine synthase pre-ATP-grasp-like domain-containing protein n=1 Tax=Candidatus Roizmanbacteria bacterium RIFCSPHIGHO2_02_FULL_38_11 TaxID=1802039 RepID=A0A1F7H1T2_9BACT|nr:MAG: hypothetical protein A3C25_01650 [Candidatus Roizmanbacteria bacterium RIFCSPHIGHO2_02_FULL_38_11]OGK32882.1 MAG: hypothetical protein A3F58_01190 [Candidatus Roizmanbacteria bacterium RIFCSPHIGHO2_12_FULL_37_9b]OGK42515.1 MAG: hypothetical protein A3A46_01350 [Candidatus Roizmanbacteria bacterium RIFCSPLOWO2_01_FULL_37_13]
MRADSIENLRAFLDLERLYQQPDITLAEEMNAATMSLAKQVEIDHPAFSKERRLREGFTVKGWEKPIEFLAVPRIIKEERFKKSLDNTILIDRLINLAIVFLLSDGSKRKMLLETLPDFERGLIEAFFGPDFHPNEIADLIKSSPYYGRLDQLIMAPENANYDSSYSYAENDTNAGLAPIEMNRNGPEGLWYNHVVQLLYNQLYGFEPPVDSLNFVEEMLRLLALQTNKAQPVLGLVAPPDSIISVIELPRIAEEINRRNRGFQCIYGNTDELDIMGSDVFLNGVKISAIWRNWGVQIQGDPKKTLNLYKTRTPILNPPHSFLGGLKVMFAIISTNQEFKKQLPPELIKVVDDLIPRTYLLTSSQDFDTLPRAEFIYKPAYSSHGNGVTSDAEKAFSSVRDKRVPYIAQIMVPPNSPKIESAHLSRDGLKIEPAFGDLNMYLYANPNGSVNTGLMVARFKDTHPINVAQGGGCGTAYAI